MKHEKCDVAIIGSGFGGLTAGAILSRAGYSVIVAERLPWIGGRCANVNYRGYRISTGSVWVMEGAIKEIFGEAGAPYELRCPKQQNLYRVRGKDYEMPEKGGLRTMMEHAGSRDGEAEKIMRAMKQALVWQSPNESATFSEWLNQYTTNPAIHGIFQAMVSMSIGISIWEMPAREYFDFLKEITTFKTYGYGPEGLGKLMDGLAGVIKACGGEVWSRSPATRILVQDGAVKGMVVRKADGEEVTVSARAVLSNAGPRNTISLAGKENFDISHIRLVENVSRPAPQISILLSSDRPVFPYEGNLFLTESRRVNVFTPVGYVCPDMAPRGKYSLEVGASLTSSRPPYDLRKDIELAMLDVEDHLPGFRNYCQVIHVGCFHSEWPLSRSWAGYNLPSRTSIEDLYDVGDGAKPAGYWGTLGAGWSARRVIADIKKRIKPGEGA
ncbi:MAG: NAD(P)/FAD-dependent oxidoreductase [Chloroflexi bacterium]|nr:NAD(P)/FAD-dependent oxidoreductase [Chloroflexota bacterium]